MHDLVEASAAAGDIAQSTRWGGDAVLRSFMLRARVPGPADKGEHERAHGHRRDLRRARRSRGEPQAIVEYIAGMTDRFALEFVEQL